jgi:hypothetical protein
MTTPDTLKALRDDIGRVLCCHGRPMTCLECGEEYAAELEKPAEPTPPAREPRADVRELAPASRPETGPMRFGGDWCGVFIRGDNAAGYALALGLVLDGHDRSGLYATQLRGLIDLFAGCTEMNKPQAQQATLMPAPADDGDEAAWQAWRAKPADIVTIRQQIEGLPGYGINEHDDMLQIDMDGEFVRREDVLSRPSLTLAEVVTVQAHESEQAPAKPKPLE